MEKNNKNVLNINVYLNKKTKTNPSNDVNTKIKNTDKTKPKYFIKFKINNNDILESEKLDFFLDRIFFECTDKNFLSISIKVSKLIGSSDTMDNIQSIEEYENDSFQKLISELESEINKFLKTSEYKSLKDNYEKAFEKIKEIT